MAGLRAGKDSRGKGGQRGQGGASCEDVVILGFTLLCVRRGAVGGSQVPEQGDRICT